VKGSLTILSTMFPPDTFVYTLTVGVKLDKLVVVINLTVNENVFPATIYFMELKTTMFDRVLTVQGI
jgi:hypothetical protein